jgi:hypothetical protein
MEALKCYAKNKGGYSALRVMVTRRIEGELATKIVLMDRLGGS